MSEEEIINKLQEMIGLCTEEPTHISYNEKQAIRGLLDLYQKEKSRIMELVELLDKQESEIKSLEQELEIEKDCSISKDKIREKIKEIAREKQLLEDKKVAGMMIYTPYQIVDSEILRLQELLEEK